MSVSNEATEALSVKRGHLIDAGFMACGAHAFTGGTACAGMLSGMLREFATRHALPRTLFLIAEEEAGRTIRDALDDPSLHALWLSDTPVSVISIRLSQFSTRLKTQGHAEGNVRLGILALSATHES